MCIRVNKVKLTLVAALVTLIIGFSALPSYGSTEANGIQTPLWSLPVPARTDCPGGHCQTSSPVLADLNGDGRLDIVIGTSNGHVVAIRHDGVLLWDVDVAPYFGMAANQQQIHSSPAVADINNDGFPEIVVGAGAKSAAYCTQGGVIVLRHNGQLAPGSWPFLSADTNITPIGCRETIYATPALGDLTRDGYMEIVVGGFDKRIYVLRHNGQLLQNFPIDSYHSLRFPTWADLRGKLADSIWGSASLADMNGDGYLDIILSTDEGNFDDRYPGGTGWTCPYTLPAGWAPGYCGGSIYVFDRFGNHFPGFPKRILEVVQSSPALFDVNNDGIPEIFVGTGDFYYNQSPDHPTHGFRVYGWDYRGNAVPGWEGGKVTGGPTPASPAIGDITGDGVPEVVALGMDSKLYAWHLSGATVAGFPMVPRNAFNMSNPFNVGFTPILGDYTGDGKMEIFVRVGWEVVIVNGNGQILTNTNNAAPNGPQFYAYGLLDNNPALGDLNNDGKLELIAFNNTLYVWTLPNAGNKADWAMFRKNAVRTGYQPRPVLKVTPGSATILHEIGNPNNVQLRLNLGGVNNEPFTWQFVSPAGVSVSPPGGLYPTSATAVVTVSRAMLAPGTNDFALIVNGTADGRSVANSPVQVPLRIILVNQVYETYLPFMKR